MYCDSKHRAHSIKTFYTIYVTTAGLFLLSVSFLGLFGLAVPLQDMLCSTEYYLERKQSSGWEVSLNIRSTRFMIFDSL